MRLAFQDPAFGDWAADCLDPRWVEHPQVRAILETAAQTGDPAEVLVNTLDGSSSRLLTAALVDATEIPQPGRQLQDLVTRLRDRFLDRQLANLTRVLAQPNLPEEELLRTLEEQRALDPESHDEAMDEDPYVRETGEILVDYMDLLRENQVARKG